MSRSVVALQFIVLLLRIANVRGGGIGIEPGMRHLRTLAHIALQVDDRGRTRAAREANTILKNKRRENGKARSGRERRREKCLGFESPLVEVATDPLGVRTRQCDVTIGADEVRPILFQTGGRHLLPPGKRR